MKYNKLVRDKIPEIIKKEGKVPSIKILNAKEFESALRTKLVEESKEVEKAKTRDELVKEISDVEEVLLSLLDANTIDCREVTKERNNRKKSRGAFEKRIFLKSVQ